MYKKSITIIAVLATSILAVVAITTPFAYASGAVRLRQNKKLSKRMCVVDGRYVTIQVVNAENDLAISNINRIRSYIPLIINASSTQPTSINNLYFLSKDDNDLPLRSIPGRFFI